MVTTRRGAGKSTTPGPSTPGPSRGPARRSNNRRITIARSPSKTLSPSPAHAETPPSRRAARAATSEIKPGTYTEESTSSSSSDAASSPSSSSHASPAASKSPSPSPAVPATARRPRRRSEKRKASSSSSSPAATPEASAAAAPRRGERLRRASAIASAARGPQLGTTKRKIVSSAADRRRRRERDRLRRQQKRREREREEEGQDSGSEESPDENDPAVKAYRRIQANGEFVNFWYPPFDGTLAPLDHAAQGETQEGEGEGNEGQDGGQDEGEGEEHQLQRGATGVMEIADSESEPEDLLQHHEQAGEPMDVETGGEAVVETGGDVVMETAGEVVAEQEGEEHGAVVEEEDEEPTVDYATTDILTGRIVGPGFLPQWTERVPADMGILRELEAHRARHAALNSGWPFTIPATPL
ncbi:hypothetical protein BFW01_g599 [Lasiodiplodia theobromae]|nr:hypothetical protein BFW01_g599 [Lasiodiplodia theobromae]